MLQPLLPTERVPALRTDLTVENPPAGRGEDEVRISHAPTGRTLLLKGFEVSIARMINGVRTAQEVIDSAAKIGLPLTIEGLNRFLIKLDREGFLAGAALPSS